MRGGVGLRRARERTVDCSTLARLTSHFDRSRLSPAPMQKNCAAQASGGSDASGRGACPSRALHRAHEAGCLGDVPIFEIALEHCRPVAIVVLVALVIGP